MIAKLIKWSVANRFLVLMAALLLAAWGTYAVLRTPVEESTTSCDFNRTYFKERLVFRGQAP
jgi:Cu(I)/Ag(I) efflux system membrane protein CusA/SilA